MIQFIKHVIRKKIKRMILKTLKQQGLLTDKFITMNLHKKTRFKNK